MLIVVMVIDRDRSPLRRYEYMLLCPPPGQHPATKIPRDTVVSSVTVFPIANASCKNVDDLIGWQDNDLIIINGDDQLDGMTMT